MDTITFKGFTANEVPARVRARQTNDARRKPNIQTLVSINQRSVGAGTFGDLFANSPEFFPNLFGRNIKSLLARQARTITDPQAPARNVSRPTLSISELLARPAEVR